MTRIKEQTRVADLLQQYPRIGFLNRNGGYVFYFHSLIQGYVESSSITTIADLIDAGE